MFFSFSAPILRRICRSNTIIRTTKRNLRDIAYYEPPYLDATKPKFPHYEALTVQIKGYDYPALENFQRKAHTLATYMDISVASCWAHPAKHFEVQRFKRLSNIVDTTYKILIYERNLKLVNVNSLILPLYIELIQAAMPEGSTLNVFPYDSQHEKDRYVPDHDLHAKMKELNELGGIPADAPQVPDMDFVLGEK